MSKPSLLSIAAWGLAMAIVITISTGDVQAQEEPIYGNQLMTEQERDQYRSQMQAARSETERDQLRWEHHLRMQERAKERGIILPDEPPMIGMHRPPAPGARLDRRRLPGGGGGGRRGN